MLAPNHLGYADLIVIGSQVECMFVAKEEMLSWPIAGNMFRSSGGIAAPRTNIKALRQAIADAADRLRQSIFLCVFLEGTSSGGGDVKKFHTTFLESAIDASVPVIPVAIHWHSNDDRILVSEDIAYWKDHTLVPHLWRFLGLHDLKVDLVFGDPIPAGGRDRRELAAQVHDEVVRLLSSVQGQQ